MGETERLEQLEGLSTSRNRVTEVLLMMPPLVERLAGEGDPLARCTSSRGLKA